MLLPALSRAEPEFFIRKGQAKPEGRQLSPRPSSFSMKKKSTSRSPKAFSLPRRISLPSSSLSFMGSIPLSERRQAFWNSLLGAPGLFWFEHRLKHDWRGPSYAMRSIQKKPLGSCRDDKKKALSCVALKKGPKRRASYLRFLTPAPAAARPALEGKISKAGKDRGRGSSILFSSRELQDRRSIRNGRRLHFVGRSRNDPIHSGLRGTKKRTLLT